MIRPDLVETPLGCGHVAPGLGERLIGRLEVPLHSWPCQSSTVEFGGSVYGSALCGSRRGDSFVITGAYPATTDARHSSEVGAKRETVRA